MSFCTNCGNNISDLATSCPQCGHPTKLVELAEDKKSQLSLILLCWLLGVFGAHRFYAGKIVTAILMILTFGGCGIWAVIDLIICLSGKFKDKNNVYIKDKTGYPILSGIIIAQLLFSFFVILAIAIPQYGKYHKGAQENAAQSAYHAVAMSEEAFFAINDHYTDDIEDLIEFGLVLDPNIIYSNIKLVTKNNTPGYAFSVQHKNGSTIYKFNSSADVTVTTEHK